LASPLSEFLTASKVLTSVVSLRQTRSFAPGSPSHFTFWLYSSFNGEKSKLLYSIMPH
jgi:hypothetical protein